MNRYMRWLYKVRGCLNHVEAYALRDKFTKRSVRFCIDQTAKAIGQLQELHRELGAVERELYK